MVGRNKIQRALGVFPRPPDFNMDTMDTECDQRASGNTTVRKTLLEVRFRHETLQFWEATIALLGTNAMLEIQSVRVPSKIRSKE